MRRRTRKLLGLALGGAIVVLPPPGDEILGIDLAAAIGGTAMSDMADTSTGQRGAYRRTGAGDSNVARWVGIIVIGSIVILAVQVGGLRGFVQH